MFNSFESDDCQMIYAITISAVSSLKNRFKLLFVETTKLFISNSVRVHTDTFTDTLSQVWGF